MTKYELLVGQMPSAALVVDGSKVAYIDETGTLRTGLYGVSRANFSVFAAWVASLAAEADLG